MRKASWFRVTVLLFLVPAAAVGLTPLLSSAKSSSQDRNWPQWRGPQSTGAALEGNPPVEWGEDKNVRWKVEIPGRGLSTPIIWGNRVFVTTSVETDKPVDPKKLEETQEDLPSWRRGRGVTPSKVLEFVVMAIDRRDGKILWRRSLREAAPHEGTHTTASWASNSPATDGKYLIAHFGSNGIYGLDTKGTLKWERDLGDMRTRNGFGEGSSVVIHDDTVILNWDHEGQSFIIALHKKTGKTLWKADRDEVTSWSTPIVVRHDGKPQVVINATGRTRSYDLATGRLVWEAAGMTVNTIPSPVSADGRVYVMSGFRGNALQAIDLASAKGNITDSPAIAWQYDQDTPYVPSPLLYHDRIYFLKHIKGILSCFDAKTGEAHYGPQRLEGIESVYASPVAAAGRVYIAGRSGTTVVIKDGPGFEELARNTLDDSFDASPAIAGDELYLRGHKHLYCLAEDGS